MTSLGKKSSRRKRNEGCSDVILSAPDEVSHWQAACESGRVWQRLLRVAVTEVAGFRMR